MKSIGKYIPSLGLLWFTAGNLSFGAEEKNGKKPNYGMGIYIKRCIGCGSCAKACKEENNVPREPFFSGDGLKGIQYTWMEW